MKDFTNHIDGLDLFPLGMTLFPDGIMTLNIFEPRYLSMIKRHFQRGDPFGVVTLLEGFEVKLPAQEIKLSDIGTLAKITQFEELQPAMFRITCMGWRRFKINYRLPPLIGVEQARVTLLDDDPIVAVSPELQGVADTLGQFISQNQARGIKLSEFPFAQPFCLDESGWVANRWAQLLALNRLEKVRLLGELDPLIRLIKIRDLMNAQSS